MKTRTLLLEIGCEELPPGCIRTALDALSESFRRFALLNGVGFGETRTWATPRRLALFVASVAVKQDDAVEEIKGPPAASARDPDGSYNLAAEKFAASRGGALRDVVTRDTPRGEYLFLIKKRPGERVVKLLPDFLRAFIREAPFPRRMRWTDGAVQFARPIRWIVFLFGKTPLKVDVDGLVSGAVSRGHRFLSPGKIRIADPEGYLETLEGGGVIADHRKRKEMIRGALNRCEDGVPVIREALLDEVSFLVEYPFVARGSFPPRYLEIPRDVLVHCIEKTQKFFPVQSADASRLLPAFLAVVNVPLDDSNDVISSYEKVLVSRLKDAVFFYGEDLKTPLADRVERLKKVVFQKDLGTLYDKTQRLVSLAGTLAGMAGLDPAGVESVRRAALLCKADLTTHLVFEFPEMQGAAGSYYASRDGEPADVAEAIRQHYKPRSADDDVPGSAHGAVLSIADKLDTLAGCFSAGIVPTGSEDPFSLRRQALGVIRILDEKKFPLSLNRIARAALDNYPEALIPRRKRDATAETLLQFIAARLRTYLMETRGASYDAVDAVDFGAERGVASAAKLVSDVESLRRTEDFQNLLEVFDRVSNILFKSASSGDFTRETADPSLFRRDEEREMHRLRETAASAWGALDGDDYAGRIRALYAITPAAHAFFDRVTVMHEDRGLRANRLALLKDVRALYLEIADFSKIVKGAPGGEGGGG
ncbi:MAG: glycine--tRNA ligase subunit beta [bacterium]